MRAYATRVHVLVIHGILILSSLTLHSPYPYSPLPPFSLSLLARPGPYLARPPSTIDQREQPSFEPDGLQNAIERPRSGFTGWSGEIVWPARVSRCVGF